MELDQSVLIFLFVRCHKFYKDIKIAFSVAFIYRYCKLQFLQLIISVDFLLKFILDPVALFCFVEQFSAIRCKYKN